MSEGSPYGRLPSAFTAAGTSSFTDFLGAHAPELRPGAPSAAAR